MVVKVCSIAMSPKKTRTALKSLFFRLNTYAREINAGLIVVEESSFEIVFATRLRDQLGYVSEDLVGQDFGILFDENFRSRHIELMQQFKQEVIETKAGDHSTTRAMAGMRKVPAIAANNKIVDLEIAIDYHEVEKKGYFVAIIFPTADGLESPIEEIKATIQNTFTQVDQAAQQARRQLLKAIALRGGSGAIVVGLLSWALTNGRNVIGIYNDIVKTIAPSAVVKTEEDQRITVRDRDSRMNELKDRLGALSVALYRLDETTKDKLVYVHDLDNQVDIFVRSPIDVYSGYVDAFNSFSALDCYPLVKGDLSLSDLAVIIDPKFTSLKKGDQVYIVGCPTYFVEADAFKTQSFDGAIFVSFPKPIKDPLQLQRATKVIWQYSPVIKPPTKDGFNFKP